MLSTDREMEAFVAGWFAHARQREQMFVEDAWHAYRTSAPERCPHDGQTLAWHMKAGLDPRGNPRTNAAFIGCHWPAELDHERREDSGAMSAETESRVALLLCERHQSASPTRQPCAACTQDARTAVSMTLTDFLLARIAEDEVAAADPYWGTTDGLVGSDRMLAECEAKRRIVERFDNGTGYSDLFALMALPYADHPDYREAWRP